MKTLLAFKPKAVKREIKLGLPETANMRTSQAHGNRMTIWRQDTSSPAFYRRLVIAPPKALALVSIKARVNSDVFVHVWDADGNVLPQYTTPLVKSQRVEQTDVLVYTGTQGFSVGVSVPTTNRADAIKIDLAEISVSVADSLNIEANDASLRKKPIQLGSIDVYQHSIYSIDTFFEEENIPSNTVYIEGIDPDSKKRVFKRYLTPDSANTSVVFNTEEASSIRLRLCRQKEASSTDYFVRLLGISARREHEPLPPFSAPYLQKGAGAVAVSIATYPLRKEIIGQTLLSLKDQCDVVRIYFNNYDRIPDEVGDALSGCHWEAVIDRTSKKRASAKFHWAYEPGYHIICDDDIIYPTNYTEHMIGTIDRYQRSAIIGVHGVLYSETITDSKNSRRLIYDARTQLEEDEPVHLLGTGTVAFHSSTVSDAPLKDVERIPYSIDEAFCVICKRHRIPLVAVTRPEAWLKVNPRMRYGLHEEKLQGGHRRREITELLQRHQPWTDPKNTSR
ncbi:hypothetical protein JYP52_16575 [Nitratireductor aquibiodomus]|uniref:hypothetical protein n=1 Tax=Nitratireductor aquibiodomus TaxID=204799 RepID=UPI0019D3E711|nr:hypothetical protein [Nitratireductor aquibiodomus]MBN7762757.1 hypothetical protein [Nitratireductor aquibiodomus]